MDPEKPPANGSAEYPSKPLRDRLKALGIAPGRHLRQSLATMLEQNCGVHVEGTSEELAELLIQMIDREPAIAERLRSPE